MKVSTYVADHGDVPGLRHDGLDVAGALRTKDGVHTVAQHIGNYASAEDRFSACVIPLQHQRHVRQQFLVLIHLRIERFSTNVQKYLCNILLSSFATIQNHLKNSGLDVILISHNFDDRTLYSILISLLASLVQVHIVQTYKFSKVRANQNKLNNSLKIRGHLQLLRF